MSVSRLYTARIFAPYARLAWRYMDDEDVWKREPIPPNRALLGSGCTQEIEWYLAGESQVEAKTLAQVCRWLRGCTYIDDDELFQLKEFWQHPRTFEQIRRGDCEDFSLWAWKKLTEIGCDAEFVVGERLNHPNEPDGLHGCLWKRKEKSPYWSAWLASQRIWFCLFEFIVTASSLTFRWTPDCASTCTQVSPAIE